MLLELHLQCTGLFIQGNSISFRSGDCVVRGLRPYRLAIEPCLGLGSSLARDSFFARSLFLFWGLLIPRIRHCCDPTGNMRAVEKYLLAIGKLYQPIEQTAS